MAVPGMDVTREVPGMFYHACQMTAHHYGAHFVIVDLSPSSAIFNRFAVLSSHGLVIPMCVDAAVSLCPMQALRLWAPCRVPKLSLLSH